VKLTEFLPFPFHPAATVTILARLQITPSANRRYAPRRRISLGSSLEGSGDGVVIHDLSSTGMLIETVAELRVLDKLEIALPEAGTARATVVWSSGRFHGCQFKSPISQAALSASQLRSPPLTRPDGAQPPAAEPAAANGTAFEHLAGFTASDEGKAPLSTRLRVIFGSALILWAFIIWGFAFLMKALAGRAH
jgi:hypothetical protein